VQWAVKQVAKAAGIIKEVHTHVFAYATHLLEDGMDIMTLKDPLGHQNVETTMEYPHIAQLRVSVFLVHSITMQSEVADVQK
jgi:site-specific recombinase XerD